MLVVITERSGTYSNHYLFWRIQYPRPSKAEKNSKCSYFFLTSTDKCVCNLFSDSTVALLSGTALAGAVLIWMCRRRHDFVVVIAVIFAAAITIVAARTEVQAAGERHFLYLHAG